MKIISEEHMTQAVVELNGRRYTRTYSSAGDGALTWWIEDEKVVGYWTDVDDSMEVRRLEALYAKASRELAEAEVQS